MPKIRAIHHSAPPLNVHNSDISTQLTILQTTMGNIVTAFEDFRIETRTEIGEIKTFYATLAEKFNERRQTNWPLVLSWLLAAMTIVSAAFYIVSLKTENIVSPVKQELTAVKSVVDTLNVSADKRDERLARSETETQILHTKLTEIESQFRNKDQETNIHLAVQERMNNILMQISQGRGGKENPILYPEGPHFFGRTTADGGAK